MGCGASSSPELRAQTRVSLSIDADLREEAKESRVNNIKILLLGTSSAGKTTFAKQLRVLYRNGYSHDELLAFRDIVRACVWRNMGILVSATRRDGVDLHEDYFSGPEVKKPVWDEATVSSLRLLWATPELQKCVERAVQVGGLDHCIFYFMEHISRIGSPDYVPTVDDLVRARMKTTGLIETEFFHANMRFLLVDVGGQRNERRKWIHAFEDVNVIVFVQCLVDYEMVMEEDGTTNRMLDSLKLFDDVINNRWFKSTNVIVFFNKLDLLEKCLMRSELSRCFPEFKGRNAVDAALEFLKDKFFAVDKKEDSQRALYRHNTCALDTNNVKVVFGAVCDIFLKRDLGF